MYSLRRGMRLISRVVFVVLIAVTAGLAPVAALPFMYMAQRWRDKEVAVLIVSARTR